MTRDIPEIWIEKLFARMSATYGARFADMWRGVEISDVKATWRAGLADVSDAGLRRGVAKLITYPHPPDLPAFRRLCEVDPAMYRPNLPALTDESNRTPPDRARAELAKLADSLLRRNGPPAGGGIRWAYRILQRAADGASVMPHQVAFAKEAIEAYNRPHGGHRDDMENPEK